MESERGFVRLTIGHVENKAKELHSTINDRVNKVLKIGKSFVDGKKEDDEGNPLDYTEVYNLVENMYLWLAQQYKQLTEDQTITPIVAVRADVHHIPPEENIIDHWRRVAGSTDCLFNVNTGIFTAPVAGLYSVALSMLQASEVRIELRIMKIPSGRDPSVRNDRHVAKAFTDNDSTSCGLVDMRVNDMLYVCTFGPYESPSLVKCRFSIFLLK